jgi:nucleoside-diphosphate-sugar epimerase
MSVISVDDLADIVAVLATAPWTEDHRGAFHANDAHPVSFSEIALALSQCVGSALPSFSLPFRIAQDVILRFGRGLFPKGGIGSLGHRLFLVSRDHYYDSGKLRTLVAAGPMPSLPEALPRYASWYRQFVHPGPGGAAE